jgi:hypothetical protein
VSVPNLSSFLVKGDSLSRESVELITGKIVLNASFREALLADPDHTLSPYELTESERASLKCLDSETMEVLAHTLEVRVATIHPGSRDTFLHSGKQQKA